MWFATDNGVTRYQRRTSSTVNPVNDAPVADAQFVETNEDRQVAITLTGSDVGENPLTYSVVTNPSHGTLSETASNPTYL